MTAATEPSTTFTSPPPRTGKTTIWIDGEWFDRDTAKVSVFDHGLLYGDGVGGRDPILLPAGLDDCKHGPIQISGPGLAVGGR